MYYLVLYSDYKYSSLAYRFFKQSSKLDWIFKLASDSASALAEII